MTKRCETMTLDDVKEGICLSSKLLSKVMPSMKTVDTQEPISSKDQRKELEGSSEHELNEWSVIELEPRPEGDSNKIPTLESSETVQNGITKEEVEKERVSGEKEADTTAEGDGQENDKLEDTQESLDEWSDFNETDPNFRSSEIESSESSNELSTVDSKTEVSEKSHFHESKTVGRGGAGKTQVQQPFQSSLIQACVKYFQEFFARFVMERVLKRLNSLSVDSVNSLGVRSKQCYTAVRASGLISESTWKELDNGSHTAREKQEESACQTEASLKARRNVVGPTMLVSSFRSMQSSRKCAGAFVAACKLLLELSCFPVCSGRDSDSEEITTDQNEGTVFVTRFKYSLLIFPLLIAPSRNNFCRKFLSRDLNIETLCLTECRWIPLGKQRSYIFVSFELFSAQYLGR